MRLRSSVCKMSLFHKSQTSHRGGLCSCEHLPSIFMPQPRKEETPNSALPADVIKWEWGGGSNHYTIQKADLESNWASLAGTFHPFPSHERTKGKIYEAKASLSRIKTPCPAVLLPTNCTTRGPEFQGEMEMEYCPWLIFLRTSLRRM